jgi:hypothetical protein
MTSRRDIPEEELTIAVDWPAPVPRDGPEPFDPHTGPLHHRSLRRWLRPDDPRVADEELGAGDA